jgi:hypothetical protein
VRSSQAISIKRDKSTSVRVFLENFVTLQV